MLTTNFCLYLITDRTQTGGRPLATVVRQALEGGVKAVQLREKDLSASELYNLAVEIRQLTRSFGVPLIINDRLDIALAIEADGVHLGINSLPVAAARKVLGEGRIIGYSAHAIDEAIRAEADGADFVTFGPVYHTPSKAAYGEPTGVKKLAEVSSVLKIPVIALGGISHNNVIETMSANNKGIAVISAVLASADPRDSAASLLKKIEKHAQHS
jgi:thiamine-phosphate pyrophosphorylase